VKKTPEPYLQHGFQFFMPAWIYGLNMLLKL